MPALREISLSSVIFCKPYLSTAWSALSLQNQTRLNARRARGPSSDGRGAHHWKVK